MAATWSPALVKNTSQAIALEARAIGQGSCYCPVLDLAKEPRWGRIGENFGEDKFLTAQLGWNYVKGLQNGGELSDIKGAIASVKHFLAHGSPEGGRYVNRSYIAGFFFFFLLYFVSFCSFLRMFSSSLLLTPWYSTEFITHGHSLCIIRKLHFILFIKDSQQQLFP